MEKVLFFMFFLNLVLAQPGPGNTEKCYEGLGGLNKDIEDLSKGINSAEDLMNTKDQIGFFMQKLRPILSNCFNVFGYDFGKPLIGYEPDFSLVVDCKSAYVELINQIRRVINAYSSEKIGDIQKASQKIKSVQEKIKELCSDD